MGNLFQKKHEVQEILNAVLDESTLSLRFTFLSSLLGLSNTALNVNLASALQALLAGAENDSILVAPMRRSDAFQATITSADATAATEVKGNTSSKKHYVTDMIVSVDTAMSVQFQDDAGTPAVLMEQIYLPANSVFAKRFATPLVTATNVDIDVITSVAGNISVTLLGYTI